MRPDRAARRRRQPVHGGPSRPRHTRALAIGTLLAGLTVWSGAGADTWRIEPSANVSLVGTDNVGFAAAGSERRDVVLTVSPQFQLQAVGTGYRLVGTIGADGVSYLGRTYSDRIMPRVSVDGSAVLVDRLLFVEGDISSNAMALNTFGVLTDGTTAAINQGITTRASFSPYLAREISPRARVLVRSDNVWVQSDQPIGGATDLRSYVQSDVARFDYRPQPWGLRAEVTRLDSPAPRNTVAADNRFDVARLTLLYAPMTELQLGIDAGRERATYGFSERMGTIRGGSLRWQPTERTVLDGLVEKRFFGTGWNVGLTHRSPFVAITATADKQATTYSTMLASLQPGNSVTGLLDAALTTQFPDPIQRAAEVAALMARYNLPANLSSPLDLYANTAQIQRRINIAVALLGTRHTVTVSLFRQEGSDLLGPNEAVNSLNSASVRQLGGTLNVTRRLTPDMTGDFSVTLSRVAGYGIRDGQRTTNQIFRLGATRNLSPRTSVTGGLRYQVVDGSGVVNLATDVRAASVYAGALHRF